MMKRRHKGPTSVVELGVEVTPGQLKAIEAFLLNRRIPYYVEPTPEPPYYSLEDLEADCEGK